MCYCFSYIQKLSDLSPFILFFGGGVYNLNKYPRKRASYKRMNVHLFHSRWFVVHESSDESYHTIRRFLIFDFMCVCTRIIFHFIIFALKGVM